MQEDDEADELRHDVPPRAVLGGDDLGEPERLRHQHDAEHAQRERDLVGDELRARAHGAEERVLRVRGPAADDEAVGADRADREDQDQRDRDVGDHAGDVDAADLPAGAERDHRERRERREGGDERREDVEHVDGARREEALLADELHQVGDRLQQAEGAGAVRPVAELHAAHDLALGERQVGEADHDEVDDHERLDHADPPGLVSVTSFTTSTSRWRSAACSSAMRAVPAGSVAADACAQLERTSRSSGR